MKILFYNWVPFDDPAKRGGGVTVYLNTLIESLAHNPENEVFFLNSGLSYSFNRKLYIKKTTNRLSPTVQSYEIINSPVHAPACMQFSSLSVYLNDTSLLNLLKDFCAQVGSFDVIHFHGLEGLSIQVLKLKEFFPSTKIFFSLHNYFLFCPQVDLWNSNGCNCFTHSLYPSCSDCVVNQSGQLEETIASLRSFLPFSRDSKFFHVLKRAANVARQISSFSQTKQISSKSVETENIFNQYRRQNVFFVNHYVDQILAVSHRVAYIAEQYGISKNKLFVDYIGSSVAENLHRPKESFSAPLHIAYLGYARTNKGFSFFLQALHELPIEIASQIDLTLAAKCTTPEQYQEFSDYISSNFSYFHSVNFLNGYTKSQQTQILSKTDLGIIPVLWEDNLPQVAIEYIANGVPFLCSDIGGAKELCTDSYFVFPANDIKCLTDKLSNIVSTPSILKNFWITYPRLTTMAEHCDNLLSYYKTK